MTTPLVEAWRINHEVNRTFLDGLPDEALLDRYSAKTRTIAAQFAHLHGVRVMHLEKRSRPHAAGLSSFPRGASPTRDELTAALDASTAAIAAMLGECEEAGRVKSWPGAPASFLGYLCAHEAHHRALAVVALRIAGRKIPDAVKYGLWGAWSRRWEFDDPEGA